MSPYVCIEYANAVVRTENYPGMFFFLDLVWSSLPVFLFKDLSEKLSLLGVGW